MLKSFNVTLFAEDPCNCLDTYVTVGLPTQYFNRFYSGEWYTCYPANGYYESLDRVNNDVEFKIIEPRDLSTRLDLLEDRVNSDFAAFKKAAFNGDLWRDSYKNAVASDFAYFLSEAWIPDVRADLEDIEASFSDEPAWVNVLLYLPGDKNIISELTVNVLNSREPVALDIEPFSDFLEIYVENAIRDSERGE